MTMTTTDEIETTIWRAIEEKLLRTVGLPTHVYVALPAADRAEIEEAAERCGAWVREAEPDGETGLGVMLGLR